MKINNELMIADYNVGIYRDRRDDVTDTLKASQLVMTRMLYIFNDICRRNNIKYWLDYGTLLGAVRHKGFIPWDCDVDVGMLREDYNIFKKVCNEYLPNDIFFQNSETDLHYEDVYVEAKLRDKYSSYIEYANNNDKCKRHNGLQLDIFVYDYSVLEREEDIVFQQFSINKKNYLKPLLITANDNENLQTLVPYGVEGYLYKNELFPLIEVEFEGVDMYAVKESKKQLNRLYGDYMKLPPLDQRVAHEGEVDLFNPCDHKEILKYKREIKSKT